MMKKFPGKKALFSYSLTMLLMLFLFPTVLQAIPDRPAPPRLVNDFAQMLSPNERERLERKLVDYNNAHSTQIAVVTVTDPEQYDIADFADRLAENWGVGQAGKENGLVILINPIGGEGQRRIHISVGYGLEGVIPDITASRIIENEIIPSFQAGRYFEGLNKGTDVIMQLAAGEFTAADYEQSTQPSLLSMVFPLLFIFFVLWLVSRKRNAHHSPGKSIPFWTWLWLMNHGRRGNTGSWGNFSSGRGSFGSGRPGGSGFGGFGGGRFGGGGAGGSW